MGESAGLTLRNIDRSIGAARILRNVSLEIRPKEFLTLVGPSGCGKSTLLRIIAGLDRQNGGEVWMGGRRVDGLRPVQRDVAMVFQSYALYPHMTVQGNIAVPLRMRRLSRLQRLPLARMLMASARHEERRIAEKVDTVAQSFQIRHLLARKPAQLSGGQRQRVALARAMVREPAIFLMDEPLSNLDAAMRLQARAEIAQLHRRLETTFVYVTHDQTEAMTMSDRVAVMLDGELLQVDTPDAIYAEPADIRVAEFVGTPRINILPAAVRADGAVESLGTVLPVRVALPAGTGVSVGIRPELLGLAAEGIAAQVTHVENLGSDLLIHTRLTAGEEGRAVVARLNPYRTEQPALGAEIRLAPTEPRVLVFDAAGRRVAAAGSAP